MIYKYLVLLEYDRAIDFIIISSTFHFCLKVSVNYFSSHPHKIPRGAFKIDCTSSAHHDTRVIPNNSGVSLKIKSIISGLPILLNGLSVCVILRAFYSWV